jgi:hypothetical protein
MSPQGARVAELSVPRGFSAGEIGSDYVAGAQTDEDGVERVVVYRSRR